MTGRDPCEPSDPDAPTELRAQILDAAARLVAAGGVQALTTRAVAAAARVQAPALYRLFGDKQGLLEALAERTYAAYVAAKAQTPPDADPVRALRASWDAHVAFGLANPAVFAIVNDPVRRGPPSGTSETGLALLRAQVRRIALAGRLRVSEARAVSLVHAAGTGTVMTLLEQPEDRRDAGLSQAAREAVLAAVTQEGGGGGEGDEGAAALAVALRARLAALDPLTAGERLLLGELLDRIAG